MRPGGLMRRRSASAIVDLPEPDSPAMPEALARPQAERDAVGRPHRAPGRVVPHREALDPEDVGAHEPTPRGAGTLC